MNPQDLEDLVAVWKTGSLSAAAKSRLVAVSTISRRLESLEIALGLKLLDRQARGTCVTPHGMHIAALAQPLSEQLDRVTRAADALRTGSKSMPVRISATEFIVSDVLAPALPSLFTQKVEFPVHLQSQSDIVSLAGRQADIAIRMSRPEGASLVARRLPELRLGLFASRDYLQGRSAASLDLKQERLLIYDDSYGRLPELDWLGRAGLAGSVGMRTSSTRGLLTAACAGGGIAILPEVIARRHPELAGLSLDSPIPARKPWLIVHRDLKSQPAIRLVHRWIVQTFDQLIRFDRVETEKICD